MMSSLDLLQPWLRPWARKLLATAPTAVVTSTVRTRTQQARLWRRFKAGLTQFPAAPPGRSSHEYGLAFDVKASDRVLNRLGATWRSWGGIWGGDYDRIHFEGPWKR
jgi:hypothetical protein